MNVVKANGMHFSTLHFCDMFLAASRINNTHEAKTSATRCLIIACHKLSDIYSVAMIASPTNMSLLSVPHCSRPPVLRDSGHSFYLELIERKQCLLSTVVVYDRM